MIEQTKYQKLFSTPMMRFKVKDCAVLNAALLLECEQLRASSGGVAKSNRGGWHSDGNLFESDAPSIAQVKEAARDAVLTVTKKVNTAFDADAFNMKLFSWMNANPAGGYNAPHTHPGAHWSGVYYIAQPEIEEGSSGMIEFLDPRADMQHWKILGASAFHQKLVFRTAVSVLIVFTSYLMHWVHPNQSREDRVSIAFNATFRRAKKS